MTVITRLNKRVITRPIKTSLKVIARVITRPIKASLRVVTR